MVYHGAPWYTMVPWYAMVYHGNPWCTMVNRGIPCVPRYTIIHRGVPWYDRVVTHCGHRKVPVCSGLPRYTMVYRVTAWYTVVNHGGPWYTMVRPLYVTTRLYYGTPWYNNVYHGLPWKATRYYHSIYMREAQVFSTHRVCGISNMRLSTHRTLAPRSGR